MCPQTILPNRKKTPRRRPAPASLSTETDATQTLDLELYSEHAILIDLETNTVIAEKDPDAKIYPASMTKVMTALVACEQITDWDATFTMTQAIIDPLFLSDATMAGFVNGEEVSMTDLGLRRPAALRRGGHRGSRADHRGQHPKALSP